MTFQKNKRRNCDTGFIFKASIRGESTSATKTVKPTGFELPVCLIHTAILRLCKIDIIGCNIK